MKRSTYRDRDYAFGQAMLTLRNSMGLTQAELGELLGISRYAVGDWESGDKRPKAEHLKHFVTLAVQHNAFPAGYEAEEIRALWQLARQKVLLDERWLASLLPDTMHVLGTETVTSSSTISVPRLEWGDALTVPKFYGRKEELGLLTTWVTKERCQVVSVVGFGGIGKSSLVVQLMHQVANHFQVVIWRSLRDIPTFELLLEDCLHTLAPQPLEELPSSFEERQHLLLQFMRNTRTLLVLDNLESIMEKGVSAGRLRPEYKNLGHILHVIAGTKHQSCIVLTSREKLGDLAPYEGNQSPVRTLRLAQLDVDACNRLLAEKDVSGGESEKVRLTEAYEGNPLALKIVAQTITELFNGEIVPFLEQGEVIFGGVRQLLNEQFARLSHMEQEVLIWLAILREPSTMADLRKVLVRPPANANVLEAIESLSRRSLIEQGHTRGSFTLQSVVLEYITSRLITDVSDELERGQKECLVKYGLELAHAREYVRRIETHLIAIPILDRLRSIYSPQSRLEEHLLALLKELSTQDEGSQGYGPANLIVLLRLLRGNLREIDLSNLVLRDLNLQGMEMQDAQLVNAVIENSFFTEAFDALTAVAVSSTGEYWAASSRRGEIRIWESGGPLLHRAWQGHTSTVWALTFSPDGSLLASGCNDGSVKLWEVRSGKLLWLSTHAGDVNRLSFSPDGLVLAGAGDGNDCCVYLWHVASGNLLQTIPHPNSVAVVIWSPDGQLLASGDVEGYVHLWAVHSGEPAYHVQTLAQHTHCADGLAFAPDSRTLASASWDGTVKLWEVPSGRLLQSLTGHTNRVGRVAWSPDGNMIASCGADESILLWDVRRSTYRPALRGHSSDVYDLAFTPDSRNLLSSSADGSLRVWDVISELCTHVIRGYTASIHDIDWSPDGGKLVSGGADRRVTLWDLHNESPLLELQEPIGVVHAVGWSPDGRWLASIDTENSLRLWDLSLATKSPFLQHSNISSNLAWSPDSQYLASGIHEHGVMVWNVITGEQVWIGRDLPVWFSLITWSPDGLRLGCGGSEGGIYIWNIKKHSLEQQLTGHHNRIVSLAWSPDGTHMASGARGADGGELFVWDLPRGQRLQSFAGQGSLIAALSWDLRGDRLISGSGQGTLCWWDVKSGEFLWVREAHKGSVQSLRRSPDGTRLASCGDDGAIMIWELSSGEHLQTLRRDRPYERLNITGIKGLTEAEKATLYVLGAMGNVQ